jgi:hypothetical protein
MADPVAIYSSKAPLKPASAGINHALWGAQAAEMGRDVSGSFTDRRHNAAIGYAPGSYSSISTYCTRLQDRSGAVSLKCRCHAVDLSGAPGAWHAWPLQSLAGSIVACSVSGARSKNARSARDSTIRMPVHCSRAVFRRPVCTEVRSRHPRKLNLFGISHV